MRHSQPQKCLLFLDQGGFTLIEMIVVIVITGILGGMIAIFIRVPMQGYMDSARRAEMTDIADTATRRIIRDLRIALPNSVRVINSSSATSCNGTTDVCYLEFIPTIGGGRYNYLPASGVPTSTFDVLGTMPSTFAAGDWVVVNNVGTTATKTGASTGANAYEVPPTNRAPWVSNISPTVTTPPTWLPSTQISTENRFQVISTPVTYMCSPATNTLTRYWGYQIQSTQPQVSELSGVPNAVLATNVSACNFVVTSGLVTLSLTISESGESISLYNTAYVSNLP